MVCIFFTIILLLPVISGIGTISEDLFGKFCGGLASKLLSGIVMISVLWTVLAFFLPLNFWVEGITILIGLSAFFYLKIYNDFWKFLSKQKPIFYLIFLVILLFSSYSPFILDHFGYYVPTLKWLSQISLVKGIANLDLVIGQMSVWHIFQAGFSNFSDPFLRINALVLVIYLIYIFEKKHWIHMVFMPILFLFSQSPSPDLSAIVFSLIILNEVLAGNRYLSVLFVMAAFIFSIKPTLIWVPIFVFLYGIVIMRENIKFVSYGSLLLILFFIKNIWCFGYPIFPIQFGDLGIPWKPNPELMRVSSELAIQKTYDMQYSYTEILHFSFFDSIKNWLTLKGIKSKINILFILSLVVFAVYTYFKKNKIITVLFISILIKSIIVLLFSVQYRFFLDVFFVVFFVLFYRGFSQRLSFILFFGVSIFIGIILSFPNLLRTHLPSFTLGQSMGGFQKSQWKEPADFEWRQFSTHKIGNLQFYVVKKYPYSFDTPIPAISPEFLKEDYDAGIFPQKNGEKLKDGFYWKKLDEKEKAQLKAILNQIDPHFIGD